ncbi:MAG: ABC transporter permease [Bacteroidota bacterium]
MSLFASTLNTTRRNLRHQWGSSLLNAIGLTLGILCSVIIFLTVRYEFSFDTHHQNSKQIYRVTNNYYYPTFTMYVGHTPDPMAEALGNDFPDFERVVSIHTSRNHAISIEDQLFESDILFCAPAFMQLFDYYHDASRWIIGDPTATLNEVDQTVLTQSLAKRVFGGAEEALGKTITLSNGTNVEVRAVIQDPPPNTNYPFEQLVSYATFDKVASESFGSVYGTTTFVQLPPKVAAESLQPALDRFNAKYMETAWGEGFVSMALQPLSAIHFDGRFGADNYTTSTTYLWTLGLIGLFMIVVACINFVNLATAKAITRAKEVGMRKILGSSKKHIIAQFMTESLLLAIFALGFGILLAQLSFTYFSELTNLNVGNEFTFTPDLLAFLAGLLLFITVAIGVYPALVLSKFQPLDVIRVQKAANSFKGLSLRRVLITFQLTASQALAIGAIVIASQLELFQNTDLGFDQESILVVDIHGNAPSEKIESLKNSIQQFPFVELASLSSSAPMSGNNSTTGLTSVDAGIQEEERFNVEYIMVDNDFVDAMNLEVLAGETSMTTLDQDTVRGYVVNETLIERLAFASPDEALGKRIKLNGAESTIIGVVKDFHTLSLHEEIKPVALVYGIKEYSLLSIKYQTDNLQEAIAQLETAWQGVFPDKNFDFYFQDEQMGDMYDNEIRFAKLIRVFTLISIAIACFGLIGLSAFSSVRRFKEIGIRKVLGASVPHLLFLLSREFLLLAGVGLIFSVPIAYYLTADWLADFAYRIHLTWWMVGIAGLITITFTLLTVGLQSVRAATMNPVESLRNE